MQQIAKKIRNRQSRRKRIRSVLHGTAERPRLAFFRSNKQVYVQIIDDTAGKTLVSASSLRDGTGGALARAERVGADIAERAKKAGISTVVFDRGGFLYIGSVRAFADAARGGGLHF